MKPCRRFCAAPCGTILPRTVKWHCPTRRSCAPANRSGPSVGRGPRFHKLPTILSAITIRAKRVGPKISLRPGLWRPVVRLAGTAGARNRQVKNLSERDREPAVWRADLLAVTVDNLSRGAGRGAAAALRSPPPLHAVLPSWVTTVFFGCTPKLSGPEPFGAQGAGALWKALEPVLFSG